MSDLLLYRREHCRRWSAHGGALLASHLASLRKVNEVNQPKPPITTPGEFSRLKYEREMKLQERQEQYRQQMIAQQRVGLTSPTSSGK